MRLGAGLDRGDVRHQGDRGHQELLSVWHLLLDLWEPEGRRLIAEPCSNAFDVGMGTAEHLRESCCGGQATG